MEITDLRKELHQYIDEEDDRIIKIMYELIKEFRQEYYYTTAEEKDFEDKREKRLDYMRWKLIMDEREQHLNGKGKTYTWEEVKQSILSQKRL